MKNILAWLLIASSLALTCCGQGDKKTSKDPVAKDPVLEMKDTVWSKYPFRLKAAGWVSDFDTLFTTAQAAYLDSIVAQHEKETTNEIAIVAYYTSPGEVEKEGGLEKFSFALFKTWGIGKKE